MQFKVQNADGEVELLTLKHSNDVQTLEEGTPRLGSTCSFKILEKSKFSTGQSANNSVNLAQSKYFSPSEEAPVETFTTVIGVTCVSMYDRLIDICLTRLHVGDVGQFAICTRFQSAFIITLELLHIEESPELFDLDSEKILQITDVLRNEGVQLFTSGFVFDSFSKFSQALKFLTILNPSPSDAHYNLVSTLRSNMASCHVKTGNWEDAIDLCNLVLECEQNNVKALYRRGLSYIEIQEFEKAGEDLHKAEKLDPENQAIKSKLLVLNRKTKELDAKYAQAMRKFLS